MAGKHGGRREGAGRKPKQKAEQAPADGQAATPEPERTPLQFLKHLMNDVTADKKDRLRAAIAAAQYEHIKKGDGGKKDEKADAAKNAATGRFAPAQGPRLAAVGGKAV